jgi:uncharacterized RDD family membrane protein YckC
MAAIQINTPFNLALDFESAPVYKRITAYLLDVLVMVFYSWGMRKFLYDILEIRTSSWYGIDMLAVSAPMLLYALVCEITLHGQSLGKKITGIRVMSREGGEPTVSQYLLRWCTRFFEWPLVFGFVLPGFLIVYQLFLVGVLGIFVVIIIVVTKSNQRLGDLAAGTVVVDTKIKTYLHETIFMDISSTDHVVTFPDVMKLSDRDINTVKLILDISAQKNDLKLAVSAAEKIKTHLAIQTDMAVYEFLETLMRDYNYLSQK